MAVMRVLILVQNVIRFNAGLLTSFPHFGNRNFGKFPYVPSEPPKEELDNSRQRFMPNVGLTSDMNHRIIVTRDSFLKAPQPSFEPYASMYTIYFWI